MPVATRRTLAIALTAASTIALGALVAGCGDDTGSGSGTGSGLSGSVAGAGSTAQSAAMETWIAEFQKQNGGATVSYDPVGSGGGREQFISGGVSFAGSDSPLKDDELAKGIERCGGEDKLVEIPVYVSPIAVIYNLDGVTDLQLSPDTLAKIMAGTITNWNDAAIAADNPNATLPDQRIVTVARSDKSGTTKNFTDYLAKAAPSVWTNEPDDVWPVKGGETAQGTSGVVAAVKNGSGTIGYADESQAGGLSIAKVKVGSEYVAPSAEAAAKIFEESPQDSGTGANVFTYTLKRDTTTAGVYPVVLVSYQMACTTYDSADTAALVGGFLKYVISAEGQQAAAGAAGSAPLPTALTAKLETAVAAIGSGS